MTTLPLIVGLGGINAAGRSSGFHSYKRFMPEIFSPATMHNTWLDLANRMKLTVQQTIDPEIIDAIKQGTLIRRIESFDPSKVQVNVKAQQSSAFEMYKSNLPNPTPAHWTINDIDEQKVKVTLANDLDILIPVEVDLGVSCGGDIPSGFDPGHLYNAANHPLSIRMSVYGASDAVNSLGVPWQTILDHVKPDDISVYAGSAISAIDEYSLAGLIKNPLQGLRVRSKMFALSLPEMPADFVNSYIINSVGSTGNNVGACASFLYNLRQAVIDIQTDKAKVVIVGNADAPLVPEIIEGFKCMGALATDQGLQALDRTNIIDHARACRPFSSNCGFTLGNAAQFIVLMAPELALTLGVNIYGSVADVFINADGNKKSISSPGVGNYVTFAKATALAKAILGQDNLNHTYVHAHGTGTQQNCPTESHIFNQTAKTFGINHWMVSAIKSYVGHSFSAAAGDQLVATLGAWQFGWIPGIKTIDHLSDKVFRSNLNILMDHAEISPSLMQATLINSKGFGGNNATAVILSPDKTHQLLKSKFSSEQWVNYYKKNETVKANVNALDEAICQGKETVNYQFGTSVMTQDDVILSDTHIKLSQFNQSIDLPLTNPY